MGKNPGCEFARIKDVMGINYRYAAGYRSDLPPHPFTIGARHVSYAANHYCGRLGQETLEAIPCAASQPGRRQCDLPYHAHECDHAAVVELLRSCSLTEMHEWLKEIIGGDWFKGHKPKIDGFVFLNSKDEYRIVEDKNAGDDYS